MKDAKISALFQEICGAGNFLCYDAGSISDFGEESFAAPTTPNFGLRSSWMTLNTVGISSSSEAR